jgi:serine/threonine-protein kinase
MSPQAERLAAALADRYRLERELGQGGMATVYLAQDLKHDRQVAIKVLKPELAAVLGAERFVQEIKTTAALQHPHILPLFDSGEAGGFLYYVMPYIEGETLRIKLDREHQLGIDEAVRITTEVADALDYAHRHGVIHRDIKPENILLHDGRPMVADFGIALALSAAAGGRMTETGLSLGTPHYMSPEQATAEKEITARADVYSLASVLYEMLTGSPPHVGSSAQQIIMKIIGDTPRPVTELRKSVPAHVAAAVAQALEKLPADRIASAGDFAAALQGRLTLRQTAGAVAVRPSPGPWRWIAAVAALAAVGLAGLAAWALLRVPAAPVTRVGMAFPEAEELQWKATRRFAISPDGSRIVYVGPATGGTQLWVRELDALNGRPLPGTTDAQAPFFSPDGQSVGFFTGNPGDLRTIRLQGGAAVTVVRDSASPWGGDWGEDGNIYFDRGTKLARVPASGGTVEIVSELDSVRGVTEHEWPQLLPGGRSVLLQNWHGSMGDARIGVLDLATRQVREVVEGAYGRYAAGHILYATFDGRLAAAPFDVGRGTVSGTAVALTEVVALDNTSGAAQFDVSRSGTLIYTPGGGSGTQQVAWVDRSGRTEPVDTAWRGSFGNVALSPDGTQAAVAIITAGAQQIWIKRLPSGPLTRLSQGGSEDARPVWMPDGRRLAFISPRSGFRGAWIQRTDGSVDPESLYADPRQVNEVAPAPDGRTFILRVNSGMDLLAFTRGVDTAPRPLVVGPAQASSPAVSPDGRWLAYVGTESGRGEVYVRRLDAGEAGRTQVSIDGGVEPRWSHSGRELFFRTPRGDMLVVEVTPGTIFSPGQPRVLFRLPTAVMDPNHWAYDIAPDDRRLLMITTTASEVTSLVLVLNWLTDLRARSVR